MALELIELYRKEKLHAVMAEAYMLATLRFCVWNCHGINSHFISATRDAQLCILGTVPLDFFKPLSLSRY
jgi:hypothetical protein